MFFGRIRSEKKGHHLQAWIDKGNIVHGGFEVKDLKPPVRLLVQVSYFL